MKRFAADARRPLFLITVLSGAILGKTCIAPAIVHAADTQPGPARRWSEGGDGGTPGFSRHVVPLLGRLGCSARACHGSFQGQNGFRLSLFGYDPAFDHRELTDDDGRKRVDIDAVDESLALRKPLGLLDHEGGQLIEPGTWQHRLLRQWVAGGARYDPEQEAALSKLEVRPGELHLAVDRKQSVQLQVLGHFTDGTIEDVTALAGFASNNDGVARVDDDGLLTTAGAGDTAVVVSYGSAVVTAQVIAPHVLDGPFPDFPAHNRIDKFVAAKLRKVGIPPGGMRRNLMPILFSYSSGTPRYFTHAS